MPSITDILRTRQEVRVVPTADSCVAASSINGLLKAHTRWNVVLAAHSRTSLPYEATQGIDVCPGAAKKTDDLFAARENAFGGGSIDVTERVGGVRGADLDT